MADPIVITFVAGSTLRREAAFTPSLPIVGNGPPGTFVFFPSGRRVSLPTDQVVESGDEDGVAVVGFGGMRFDGIERGMLTFRRVEDLWPAAELSPERSRSMTLAPELVAGILVKGVLVWPPRDRQN